MTLAQLEAMMHLLRELTDPDVFAKVAAKYKRPLEAAQEAALDGAVERGLELEVLLPCLLEYITAELREETGDASSMLKVRPCCCCCRRRRRRRCSCSC